MTMSSFLAVIESNIEKSSFVAKIGNATGGNKRRRDLGRSEESQSRRQ